MREKFQAWLLKQLACSRYEVVEEGETYVALIPDIVTKARFRVECSSREEAIVKLVVNYTWRIK